MDGRWSGSPTLALGQRAVATGVREPPGLRARHSYPVDTHPDGATPEGVLDVAGNVWEWTASTTMSDGVVIRGGSYAAPPLYAQCTFLNAAPAELRSRGIGLRVVREP